jgi:subtilisin family serine protease
MLALNGDNMRKQLMMVLFVVLVAGTVYAGTITPDLAAQLVSSSDKELIPVMVRMSDQADPDQLRALTTGLDKRAAREVVVLQLQNLAQSSQRNVINYLKSPQLRDQVKDITPLFIANLIGVKATPAVIHRLAQFGETADISYDPERYMLDDVGSGPVAVGGEVGIDEVDEIAWGVADIHAPEVWALGYNGTGVLVGCVDTGVNYNHLDLTTHMWNGGATYPNHGYDFVNNDNNPIDDNGHGTHTAGTVASNGSAGTQAGVAPNATIMAIKVLSASGSGSNTQVTNGMNFAVAQGCDVYNMSLGITGGGSTSDKANYRTISNNALAAGVIASISVGNSGQQQGTYPVPNNVGTPGNAPPPWHNPQQTLAGGLSNVMGIGATQSNHAIASFSSVGPVTWQNVSPWNDYAYNPGMGLFKPDVSAPGNNIKSCLYSNNTGYTLMSGTSMAAPHVTGAIALLLSKNHNLTPAQIDCLLEITSLDLGTAGKDNTYGAGLINVLNAINATPSGSPPALDITLTPVNPPIVVPAQGGSFSFNVSVVNAGPAQAFTVWCRIKNPDGSYTAPTLGPVSINPPVGVTITRLRSQTVPNVWATGAYSYIGYANTAFSYPAIDSSMFAWTKSAVAGNGPMVWEAACGGERFPGEIAAVSTPATVTLAGAYPNPFNPSTTIRFSLPEAAKVVLNVYDISGCQVAQLVNGLREAGQHQVTFNGSNQASGIYLYTLTAGQNTATGKMVLIK